LIIGFLASFPKSSFSPLPRLAHRKNKKMKKNVVPFCPLLSLCVPFCHLFQIAGLIFGAIGLGLSIFNTIKAHQKDTVNLKVIPKLYSDHTTARLSTTRIPTGTNEQWEGFCIEVINLGFFPVTIEEIGLTRTDIKNRIIFPQPEMSGGEKLPKRLESRTSISFYIPSEKNILQDGLPYVKHFYATTACGVTVRGNSEVTKWLIKKGNQRKLT